MSMVELYVRSISFEDRLKLFVTIVVGEIMINNYFAELRRNKQNNSRNKNTPRTIDSNVSSVTNHLDTPPPTPYNYSRYAGMAEQADAADLKSAGEILVGSSPSPGTKRIKLALVNNRLGLPPRFYPNCLYRRSSV